MTLLPHLHVKFESPTVMLQKQLNEREMYHFKQQGFMIKVADNFNPSERNGFFEVKITEGLITVNGVRMKIVYDKRYTFCLDNNTCVRTRNNQALKRILKQPNFHDLAIQICEHVIKFGK